MIEQISTILFSLFLSSAASAENEILDGCHGESCQCTQKGLGCDCSTFSPLNDGKAFQEFTVYEARDPKSKIIGKFQAGIYVQIIGFSTKVVSSGKAKILSVSDPKLLLKSGDIVTHVIVLNSWDNEDAEPRRLKVRYKQKWFEFEAEKIKLQILKKTTIEHWTEIKMDKNQGFVPGAPFYFCKG